MAREAIGVKRYVERLGGEERAHLDAMLRKGKHGAKTLVKARILLKVDVSEAGEGLSDGEIIAFRHFGFPPTDKSVGLEVTYGPSVAPSDLIPSSSSLERRVMPWPLLSAQKPR